MDEPIPITEEILTPRCRLRHPDASDIPHVWSATRVAGFNDGMRWDPPQAIEELRGPFERSRAAWLAGTDYNWTIEDRGTRGFLGRISIRREPAAGQWSFGFWVHPTHQGHGYAREAASAIVEFGFERLAAERITAAHAAWNQASGKVLVGIGMTFVRVNPRGFMKRGGWVEECEYEIQRQRRVIRPSTRSTNTMNLVFTKGAGKHDRLEVVRPGRPPEVIECPKQGIIPHDMVHYAVEHTLDARGFLHRVKDGETASFRMQAVDHSDAVERLVEVFQGDKWSGGSTAPAAMIDLYRVTCDARACSMLPVDEDAILAVRSLIASLTRDWLALPVGESIRLAL